MRRGRRGLINGGSKKLRHRTVLRDSRGSAAGTANKGPSWIAHGQNDSALWCYMIVLAFGVRPSQARDPEAFAPSLVFQPRGGSLPRWRAAMVKEVANAVLYSRDLRSAESSCRKWVAV